MQRNKKKKKRRINKSRLILLISFLLLLLIGSYAFFYSSIFDIKNVNINGNRQVEEESIVETMNIEIDKNIFTNSSKELASRITDNPYISSAIIKKKLPNTLNIEIEEVEAVALLSHEGNNCYIDSEGNLLEMLEYGDDKQDIITVNVNYNIAQNNEIEFENEQIEKGLPYLLECIRDNHLYRKVRKIEFKEDEVINIQTKEGINALLYNDENLEYNVSRISLILVELQNDNIQNGTIDLISSNDAIYKP